LGAILTGSFRRNGFTLRMTVGVGLLIIFQAFSVFAKGYVESFPQMWAVAYVPALLSIVVGLGLLANATRSRRMVRTS